MPKKLRRATRYVLNHNVFRYVAEPTPLVEEVGADGRVRATRPFNPVPVRRALC